MSKKVLFIAYYFPPLVHTATIRSLKFVKYLPEFGWEPIVLTIDPKMRQSKWDMLDPQMLDEVADTKIYRTPELNPATVRNYLKRRPSPQKNPPPQNKKIVVQGNKVSGGQKFLRWLKSLVLVPDQNIGWYPFAIRQGKTIIQQEKIDAIFTTSGPYSAHLLGLRLKTLTRLPWVADFRDNWTRNVNIEYPTLVHKHFTINLERQIFLTADKITTVQPDVYDPTDTHLNPSRFVHLINGFDETDFAGLKRNAPKKFTITYTGSFYRTLTPEIFFQAVARLLSECPTLKNELDIQIFGRAYNINLTEMAQKMGLAQVVHYQGVVSHQAALQAMLNAEVLLLILFNTDHASNNTVYSGKLFEYLRAGRPILGIIPPEGVAAQIIEQTGSGLVAPPGDVVAIKDTLAQLYEQWQAGTLGVDPNRNLEPYSRYGLSKKLAGVLNEISQ